MAATAATASGELVCQVEGDHVPASPPSWDPASSAALLCSQIVTHNSYVSALAAHRVAGAVVSVADAAGMLTAQYKAQSDAVAEYVCAYVGGPADAASDAEAGAESNVDVDQVDLRVKKRHRVDADKEPVAAASDAAASGSEGEIVFVPHQPASKPQGGRRRHLGPRVAAVKGAGGAVSEYTECGIRKPRIQSLRS